LSTLPPIYIEWGHSPVSTPSVSSSLASSLANKPPLGIRITPQPLIETHTAETTWQIPAHEIINLIWRISASGEISYNDLKLFRPQNAREAEIQNFLLEQSLFFVLSQVDQGKQTLSPQDIGQTARLAGNALSLDKNDLRALEKADQIEQIKIEQNKTPAQTTLNSRVEEKPSVKSEGRQAAQSQQTSPPPPFTTLPRNSFLPPTPETRQLAASIFQPVQTPPQNQEARRNQLIESVDAQLRSLEKQLQRPIWVQNQKMQEWMVAAGYLKAVDNRSKKEERERLDSPVTLKPSGDVEALQPLQPMPAVESNRFRQSIGPAIREPVWSVKDLEAFIYGINPIGTISWQELVAFEPQTPQERLFYELLSNPVLFYALAELDGDEKTLSTADIEQAAEYDHHPDLLSGQDIAHLKRDSKPRRDNKENKPFL
jgi:hypothetical protein